MKDLEARLQKIEDDLKWMGSMKAMVERLEALLDRCKEVNQGLERLNEDEADWWKHE